MSYAPPESLIYRFMFLCFFPQSLLYLCVPANHENLSEKIFHILVVFDIFKVLKG